MAFLDEAGLEALWDDVVEFVAEESVPPMSPTTRGGAKLDEHGGLVLRDEKLGIGSLVQESDGAVRGSIAGLTAEGHAEQFSTTGKNLLPSGQTEKKSDITFTVNTDGSVTIGGTYSTAVWHLLGNLSLSAGTYVLSGTPTPNLNTKYTIRIANASNESAVIVDSGNSPSFTLSEATEVVARIHIYGSEAIGKTFYPMLRLASITDDTYEPYTGGAPSPSPDYPQEIQVVRGRNLLDESLLTNTLEWAYISVQLLPNTTYIASSPDAPNPYVDSTVPRLYMMNNLTGADSRNVVNSSHQSIITTNETGIVKVQWSNKSSTDNLTNYHFQLELGSIAHGYVPYGDYVGLEVRDANDQLLSTTPIPLPSRGWVGSLPDGTADKLTIDGAGKVTWELETNEVVFDGSESWTDYNSSYSGFRHDISDMGLNGSPKAQAFCSHLIGSISRGTTDDVGTFTSYSSMANMAQVFFVTGHTVKADFISWLSANTPAFLYPLATPITEDCGYVEDWPTDIPEGVTITIPELDALNVKYFVDDSAGTLARQWYERASGESDASIDQRIELVESNIAMIESTTAKSNHAANSYFMLDNVLRKATSAIASGETISNSNSSPITVEQVITTLNNSVAALEKEVVFAITPSVSHRNIYRGKNLGTTLTTAQKAQIAAGTFDDLYVGDYWTINGRVYRIADIDYYYNTGDTAFTKHHLVIVPDANFGDSAMNDSNNTAGAYVGSNMYTSSDSVLNAARNTISNDFGSSLASHREYLPNAIDSSGAQLTGAWCSSTVELMNEPMVYGCFIHAKPTSGIGHLYTIDKTQLALFRLNPAMVNLRYDYWLRDVVSSTAFADVDDRGNANFGSASYSDIGVRPFFCIVGD